MFEGNALTVIICIYLVEKKQLLCLTSQADEWNIWLTVSASSDKQRNTT